MDKLREEKIRQLQEDIDAEWWRAGATDSYNLKNKLMRVGCRPIKRKYEACIRKPDRYNPSSFGECRKIKEEIDNCYKAL